MSPIDTAGNLDSYRDADGNLPTKVLCPCRCGRLIFIHEYEAWTGKPYNPQPLMPRGFWKRQVTI